MLSLVTSKGRCMLEGARHLIRIATCVGTCQHTNTYFDTLVGQ